MTAALGLTANQLANGRGIIAAVKADPRFAADPKLAARIAIETALVESGMRVLASANVPESQKYPHDYLSWTFDGLGHDHASMGIFQQQTGTAWTPAGYGRAMNQTTMTSANGWGPPAVLMDPEKSTTLFLNGLARVNWQAWPPWMAAQNVQHSGFPDGSNYAGQDGRAQQIVTALWGSVAHEQEDQDMVIVQDKQTGQRYVFVADRPAMRVSKVGATHYAEMFGVQVKPTEHHVIVAWDNRMRHKHGTTKVQGKKAA